MNICLSLPINVDENILKQYAGVYENENGLLRTNRVTDKQLYSHAGRGPGALLKGIKKDEFYFNDDVMVSVEFIRNAKGQVEKMVTRSRTAIDTWKNQRQIKYRNIIIYNWQTHFRTRKSNSEMG